MFNRFEEIQQAVPLYYGGPMVDRFKIQCVTMLPCFDGMIVITQEESDIYGRTHLARLVTADAKGAWHARWLAQHERLEPVRHFCEDWQADHMDAYHDLATADR